MMPDHAPDTLLVRYRSDARVSKARARAKHEILGVTQEHEIGRLRVKKLKVAPERLEEVMAALKADPDVEFVETNSLMKMAALPNDPALPSQFHLPTMNTFGAWDVTKGSASLVVAVIDTGIDNSHPDFAGQLVQGHNFGTIEGGAAASLYPDDTQDRNGHGTHVASCIVSKMSDAVGVAGIAPLCKVRSLRVFNIDGSTDTYAVANAIDYAVAQGDKVINISIESPTYKDTQNLAVQNAWAAGTIVIAATGNSGVGQPRYAAGYVNVIGVGATDLFNGKATFSNYGSAVDVVAPGVEILSAKLGGGYARIDGTSFASPLTAGTVALIRSVNPLLDPAAVSSILYSTATPMGDDPNNYFGNGMVNAAKAVMAANATLASPTEVGVAYYNEVTGKIEALAQAPAGATLTVYVDNALKSTSTASAGLTSVLIDWTPTANGTHSYRVDVISGTTRSYSGTFIVKAYLTTITNGMLLLDGYQWLGMPLFPYATSYMELWLDNIYMGELNGSGFDCDTTGMEPGGYGLAINGVYAGGTYPLNTRSFSKTYQVVLGDYACRGLSYDLLYNSLSFSPVYDSVYRLYRNGARFPDASAEFTSSTIYLDTRECGDDWQVSAVHGGVESAPSSAVKVDRQDWPFADHVPYNVVATPAGNGFFNMRFNLNRGTPPAALAFVIVVNGGPYPNRGTQLAGTPAYMESYYQTLQPDGSQLITGIPTGGLLPGDTVSPMVVFDGTDFVGPQVAGVALSTPLETLGAAQALASARGLTATALYITVTSLGAAKGAGAATSIQACTKATGSLGQATAAAQIMALGGASLVQGNLASAKGTSASAPVTGTAFSGAADLLGGCAATALVLPLSATVEAQQTSGRIRDATGNEIKVWIFDGVQLQPLTIHL